MSSTRKYYDWKNNAFTTWLDSREDVVSSVKKNKIKKKTEETKKNVDDISRDGIKSVVRTPLSLLFRFIIYTRQQRNKRHQTFFFNVKRRI